MSPNILVFRGQLPEGMIYVTWIGALAGTDIVWMPAVKKNKESSATWWRTRELKYHRQTPEGAPIFRDFSLLKMKDANLSSWEITQDQRRYIPRKGQRTPPHPHNLYSGWLVKVFSCTKPVYKNWEMAFLNAQTQQRNKAQEEGNL